MMYRRGGEVIAQRGGGKQKAENRAKDPHAFGPGAGDRVIEHPRPRRPGERRGVGFGARVADANRARGRYGR
jgi:hypothetical protein